MILECATNDRQFEKTKTPGDYNDDFNEVNCFFEVNCSLFSLHYLCLRLCCFFFVFFYKALHFIALHNAQSCRWDCSLTSSFLCCCCFNSIYELNLMQTSCNHMHTYIHTYVLLYWIHVVVYVCNVIYLAYVSEYYLLKILLFTFEVRQKLLEHVVGEKCLQMFVIAGDTF